MKRVLISGFTFLLILTGNLAIAQEKIKIKTDSSKIKSKDNKTKIKEGDDKTKMKDDKTKIKEGDDKTKIKDDKTKIKEGDDKTKMKDDKTKIKEGADKMKIKNDGMNSNVGGMPSMGYPYTAVYSSNFVMGNPAHSKMILDLWKDYDDNSFDRHDYFADTLMLYLPDGSVMNGKAATIDGMKKYRSGMTSVKSTVDSWVPLRSTDRNEDWVAIWGTETDTWADGKTVTNQIHEIWRINKDGKIDLVRQFVAKTPQN